MVTSWQCLWAFRILLFLLVNFQTPCLSTTPTDLATDQSALLALKSHITLDPDKIMTTNWTHSSSVCEWIGVTCGRRHNRVVALDISGMGIVGTIPPHLGNLSFLVSLDIKKNFFHGTLPRELSKLRRLRLVSLRINSFTGEIPSWLGSLPKLEKLILNNNSFTGSIPTSISNLSKLEVLEFSVNSLQGNIPQEFGNLGRLQLLSIQFNNLMGPIPSSVFNLSSLKTLALMSNKLEGSLPTDICRNHPFLEGIHLSENWISSQIPSDLSKCSKLRILDLSFNLFSGKIPEEICNLHHLEYLYLWNNNLRGVIPNNIGNLSNLKYFDIGFNQITGLLPISIFNISSLERLGVYYNKLTGNLSKEIGNLTMLLELYLQHNSFTGELPQEVGRLSQMMDFAIDDNNCAFSMSHDLFNLSTLQGLSLASTGLTGSLPASFCNRLPLLEVLYLSDNNIIGSIPYSISNCSKLKSIELGNNHFTGLIPHSFGDLILLEDLVLSRNHLHIEPSSSELSFITSLTNCKFLKLVSIGDNPLDGVIPSTIGNLSSSLQIFEANLSRIKGNIPPEIGNLSSLETLILESNELTGSIPHSIKQLHKLEGLFLGGNNLGGFIPNGICCLEKLVILSLGTNRFSGSIPECLGNVTSLRTLFLHSNLMVSNIPPSIWHLKNLLYLDLLKNSFNGFLHLEMSNLAATSYINLSFNEFSGHIPDTIGKLENLARLSLSHNTLQGPIPVSMGSMVNLEDLDLSYNNLTGAIPTTLQALRYLDKLNVSFNALTGEIPTDGCFKNFTAKSFMENEALCGIGKFSVPPSNNISKTRSRKNKVDLALFVLAGLIACIMVIAFIYIFSKRYRKEDKGVDRINTLVAIVPERFSYYQLLEATDQFNESNLLGIGSFGSVYKGMFRDGRVLAIQVFNLQVEATSRSFDVECEVLRGIRHRNLTKVIGSCSNMDFKALLLEYMPNKSLESWLYSHNHFMDVKKRLNIMIDVALALEYLHRGYSTPIIHCDLKPSNILLDEDMIGHVSDFGIAKLLAKGISIVQTNTLATLGYIAPEYGSEGLVSTRCDVYSYGIILMETFTRKNPSDEMFYGDLTLKSWIKDSLRNAPDQVIDANLLHLSYENSDRILNCIPAILELALKCSSEYPRDRINMKEVVAELKKIEVRLLA